MNMKIYLAKEYLKNKDILDLGCAGLEDRFVFKDLKTLKCKVKGIDIDKKRIKRLKKRGYHAELGDAQNFKFNKKFDVITALDIVEHLLNFEGFFNSVENNLKKGGYLIITTPNAYSINRILRGLVNKVHDFKEHTCIFDENLLRYLIGVFDSLLVEEIKYYNYKEKGIKNKISRLFGNFNKKWRENLMFIIKKK